MATPDTLRASHATAASPLRDRLGADTHLEIRFCGVEELERNPVGKIRSCINHLPADVIARFALPESGDDEEEFSFKARGEVAKEF